MSFEAKVLHLNNVRLSFPSVFQKAVFEGEVGKYEGTFLIDKEDTKTCKMIEDEIARAKKESGYKIPASKVCYRDGDEAEYDGYEGCMSFKATNNRRPMVVDRNTDMVTEEDGLIYAGCYVNAIVSLWVQNNSYGKRINANLLGLQFVRDGEPFGGGGQTSSPDDFDALDDDEGLLD